MKDVVSSERKYQLKERGRVLGEYTETELQDLRSRHQLSRFHQVSAGNRAWEPAVSVLQRLETARAQQLAILEADPGPPPIPADQLVAYRPFPVWLLLGLHWLSGGVFSFFWITTLHGRLPRTSPDEPSGGQALSLMLIPLVNLYWMFTCYPSLAERLNRIRERQGLLGNVPVMPPLVMCILNLAVSLMMITGSIVVFTLMSRGSPYDHAVWFFFILPQLLTAVNYVFLVPQFIATCQTAFNEIAESQQRMLAAHLAR